MATHAIRVRAATPTDDAVVDEVSRLATEDLRQVYRRDGSVPKEASLGPTVRLVAEVEGEVVGTVRYRRQGNRLHVIGLFVHPEHRRMGVARQMLRSLAGIACEAGAHCLSLFTVKETGNVRIFERLGFRAVDEGPARGLVSVRGDGLTDVYMEKPVSAPADQGG